MFLLLCRDGTPWFFNLVSTQTPSVVCGYAHPLAPCFVAASNFTQLEVFPMSETINRIGFLYRRIRIG
jgi:hypothetical protein